MLTKKQEWMLNYLKEKNDYVSPTEVGSAYGESQCKKRHHSSIASPVLLKLVEIGLVKRNDKGHYKYCG